MELISATDTSQLYSTLQGEEIDFAIGDPAIIIELVRSKIYSHPVRTLVQEYLSNALDAHQETKAPVSKMLVTLPTSLNPLFAVRDYGPGMSYDRVRDVFTKYGLSTKRKDKNQLGCFGIGGKIAWAYTDSFIVETWHDNIHTQYLAEIGERKEGRLTLVSQEPSDEPPGVKIQVSVDHKDLQAFHDAYLRATWLWPTRPQTEGRDSDNNYPEEVIKVKDVAIYNKKVYSDSLPTGVYFDVKGIPYTANLDSDLANSFDTSNKYVVIKADPLKLGISASRESFSNKDYAKSLAEKALKTLQSYVEKELDTKDLALLRKKLAEFKKLGNLNKYFKYKNTSSEYEITPTEIILTGGVFYLKKGERSRRRDQPYSFYSFEQGTRRSFRYQADHEDPLYSTKYKTKDSTAPETLNDLDIRTRRAITKARKDTPKVAERLVIQGSMSDEAYRDVCIFLGVTQDYEDVYPTETLVKTKKEKPGLAAGSVKIIASTRRGISAGDQMPIQYVFANYAYVFYSDTPTKEDLQLIDAIKKPKMVIVAADKKTHKYLEDTYLNYLPLSDLRQVVKDDKELQEGATLVLSYQANARLFEDLLGSMRGLNFRDFNQDKLKEIFTNARKSSCIDKYNSPKYEGTLFTRRTTELDLLAQTFPLLPLLASRYTSSSDYFNLLPHLQLYIDAVERTQNATSNKRNDEDTSSEEQGETLHDPEDGSEILRDSSSPQQECANG